MTAHQQTGATLNNWTPLSPSSYHHLSMGTVFGMTDVGLVRPSNEDNFLIDQTLGLVMISDGMGGHDAGEVASKEVLLALRDYIQKIEVASSTALKIAQPITGTHHVTSNASESAQTEEAMLAIMTVSDAVEFANALLYAQNLAMKNEEGHGMGTTLTGFWQPQHGGPLTIFHVGDSRLYRYHNGELSLLTRDQTLYQQALDEGLTANLPSRNMLLQAMGPYATVIPEISTQSLQSNDLYLLCTDGLHGNVSDELIAQIMSKTSATNLAHTCERLIDAAKEHGSRDNITVVLLAT
jgi:serine/threonine protein phosphatase PrpC